MSFLTCRISAESAVFPGQHHTRTGIASRVTARPITTCGRSSRESLDLPYSRNPPGLPGGFSSSPPPAPAWSRLLSWPGVLLPAPVPRDLRVGLAGLEIGGWSCRRTADRPEGSAGPRPGSTPASPARRAPRAASPSPGSRRRRSPRPGRRCARRGSSTPTPPASTTAPAPGSRPARTAPAPPRRRPAACPGPDEASPARIAPIPSRCHSWSST